MKNIENRMVVFDWMRAIAILIILFHHLPAYCFNFYDLNYLGVNLDLSSLNELNRYFGLGIFVFLSGYFINIKQLKFSDWTIVRVFWVKKILRIVPLYYLALLLFFWMDSIKFNPVRIGIHLLGLQLLFTDLYKPIRTLWFIGLIVVYYSLFCILNLNSIKTIYKFFLIIVCIILSFVLAYNFRIIDSRINLYLLVFLFAILSAKKNIFKSKYLERITQVNYVFFPLIFSLCFLVEETNRIQIIQNNAAIQNILLNTLIISWSFWVYAICDRFQKIRVSEKMNQWIQLISYSSFGMFLFHRPIWFYSESFLRKLSITNPYAIAIFLIFLGIPLIVFVSYWVQKIYDQYCFHKLARIFIH